MGVGHPQILQASQTPSPHVKMARKPDNRPESIAKTYVGAFYIMLVIYIMAANGRRAIGVGYGAGGQWGLISARLPANSMRAHKKCMRGYIKAMQPFAW